MRIDIVVYERNMSESSSKRGPKRRFTDSERKHRKRDLDSLRNSRLHFYFKIYSLKDISNFRYSNQKIIIFFSRFD
jgi:hypothetical protein